MLPIPCLGPARLAEHCRTQNVQGKHKVGFIAFTPRPCPTKNLSYGKPQCSERGCCSLHIVSILEEGTPNRIPAMQASISVTVA